MKAGACVHQTHLANPEHFHVFLIKTDPVGVELLTLLLAFDVNGVLFSYFVMYFCAEDLD